jgi:ELWxxDGT repeat protein
MRSSRHPSPRRRSCPLCLEALEDRLLLSQTPTLLKDIERTPQGNTIYESLTIGSVSFFTASDGIHGRELWRTDGTSAGTFMVKNLNLTSGSDPQSFKAVGSTLFFTATDPHHGRELWVSDGSAPGTRLVKDIRPGPSGTFDPANHGFLFGGVNGRLLFVADDGIHGQEMWASDGTAAGTQLLKDIRPGSSSGFSPIALPVVMNGRMYFGAADGTGAGSCGPRTARVPALPRSRTSTRPNLSPTSTA